MRLDYAPKAVRALTEIYNYLADKNERAAVDVHNEIVDEIDRLVVYPQMAPVEPLLADEPEMFRSLLIRRRYKAVYVVENDVVTVVDIWDCFQNPDTLKQRTIG